MQFIEQPGGRVYVAHAPVWDPTSPTLDGRDHLLIAITPKTLTFLANQGRTWLLGQLYGVVCPGLIFTKFLFQGLKRDMRTDGDGDAAKSKLAATWAPNRDARLVGDDPFNMRLEHCAAEQNRVFCVYISRNEMLVEFPHIYGWAENWTWIAADPLKPGAPIDWESRYDRVLWPV